MVQANLFKPVEQKKEYIGILQKVEDHSIQLEIDGKEIELDRNNIALLKIYYEWDNS